MVCKLPLETHSPKRDCNLIVFFLLLFFSFSIFVNWLEAHFGSISPLAESPPPSPSMPLCSTRGQPARPSDRGGGMEELKTRPPPTPFLTVWGARGATGSCWANPVAFTSVWQTWERADGSGGRGQTPCRGTQVGLHAFVSEALWEAAPQRSSAEAHPQPHRWLTASPQLHPAGNETSWKPGMIPGASSQKELLHLWLNSQWVGSRRQAHRASHSLLPGRRAGPLPGLTASIHLEQNRRGLFPYKHEGTSLSTDKPCGFLRSPTLPWLPAWSSSVKLWQITFAQNKRFRCSFQPPWGLGTLKEKHAHSNQSNVLPEIWQAHGLSIPMGWLWSAVT